jgi:hypothetical protein
MAAPFFSCGMTMVGLSAAGDTVSRKLNSQAGFFLPYAVVVNCNSIKEYPVYIQAHEL